MIEPGGDLEELRSAVRDWCATHVPKNWRDEQRGVSHAELVEFMRWWGTQLRDAGLLAPHWPKEWGGGFSIPEQVAIAEELARGDVPRNGLYHVGVFNVAPTLLHSATAEQRERFLTGIRDGEVWCQGFSEPDAGSDLASLQTRAERDGDRYVVNGQKVWTSWAREADWCMLLARTDPDASKHKGISCLIVDMHSPGIDVRPIAQAWGPSDFNEVFFDDVEVPVANLVGPEHGGWAVAQGTLAAERAIAILEATERLRCHGIEAAIAEAVAWRLESGQPAIEDSAVRELLAECYAEVHVLRHMLNAMIDSIIGGADVGGTSSIIKVFYSELLTKLMQHMTDLHGIAGQLDAPVLACAGWETGFWMNDYIHAFGWLIGGGTNEIQRNVIGEKMLGLPPVSEMQDELRTTARSLLGRASSSERVRTIVAEPAGFDRTLWEQMVELGWTSIHVAERYGGAGGGYAELGVVLHELGRALTPSPFVASAVLATGACSLADNETLAANLLAALAGGDSIGAVALASAGGSYDLSRATTTWRTSGGSVRLTGSSGFVLDADLADVLVVAARDEDGAAAAIAIEASAPGVHVEPAPTVDRTRRLFTVSFDDVAIPEERLLCEPGARARELLENVLAIGVIATACDSAGVAERAMEGAAEYAKERTQFGKPIGSFQAVKHHCANMAIAVEAARAATRAAAETLDGDRAAWAATAAITSSYVGPAASRVAALALLVHGGIGFTSEHDSHLYLKRAKLDEVLFGSPSWHRRRLADAVFPALVAS